MAVCQLIEKQNFEEDVEPILFELKIEYEKVCDMYWELTELSHEVFRLKNQINVLLK